MRYRVRSGSRPTRGPHPGVRATIRPGTRRPSFGPRPARGVAGHRRARCLRERSDPSAIGQRRAVGPGERRAVGSGVCQPSGVREPRGVREPGGDRERGSLRRRIRRRRLCAPPDGRPWVGLFHAITRRTGLRPKLAVANLQDGRPAKPRVSPGDGKGEPLADEILAKAVHMPVATSGSGHEASRNSATIPPCQ